MEIQKKIEEAKDQLDRVLSFFPRVDAKSSVLLGVNIAMMAYLVINLPPIKNWGMEMIYAAGALFLLLISLICLYLGAFPHLEGGKDSLIYFREIAGNTEAEFVNKIQARSSEDYLNDLWKQIWRNSEILKKKFNFIEWAFRLTSYSIIPWIVSLLIFALTKSVENPPFVN